MHQYAQYALSRRHGFDSRTGRQLDITSMSDAPAFVPKIAQPEDFYAVFEAGLAATSLPPFRLSRIRGARFSTLQ